MKNILNDKSIFEPNSYITSIALGNFLSFYYKDLNWILHFQKFINNEIVIEEYLYDEKWGFNKFLSSYKIIRNRYKKYEYDLLEVVKSHIKRKKYNDIIGLANILKDKNITTGNAVSLSSKILFLNNPVEIFPLDNNVKKLFDIEKDMYDDYLVEVKKFKKKYKSQIIHFLEKYKTHYLRTENKVIGLKRIEIIRLNRFIDIYLWTKGGLIN